MGDRYITFMYDDPSSLIVKIYSVEKAVAESWEEGRVLIFSHSSSWCPTLQALETLRGWTRLHGRRTLCCVQEGLPSIYCPCLHLASLTPGRWCIPGWPWHQDNAHGRPDGNQRHSFWAHFVKLWDFGMVWTSPTSYFCLLQEVKHYSSVSMKMLLQWLYS